MKKKSLRILSLVLSLVMLLSAFPAMGFADELTEASSYLESGEVGIKKLTKKEIYKQMDLGENAEKLFETLPVVEANKHAPGKMTPNALNSAIYALNFVRKLAGLKDVKLDKSYNELSQYGAVLLAEIGTLDHTPQKPANMTKAFYDKGYESTSQSNLFYTSYSSLDADYVGNNLLVNSVWAFMGDEDPGNIDRLGHRRWQLNPAMGKTGFGLALSEGTSGAAFVAEYSFDESGRTGDYNFVGWPASGNFPTTYFGKDIPWSVTLNPEKYADPVKSEITVTIEGNGEKAVFSGKNSYDPRNQEYFNVDAGGYGISNCIIFRPNFRKTYRGVYTVTIEGIKDLNGNSVDFAYQVDFFDPIEFAKFKFVKENGNWYYKNGYDEFKTGWQEINGLTYYFEKDGVMASGWKEIEGKSYYFKPGDGVMMKGWLREGNAWYYLAEDGHMATGLTKVGDKSFYLGADGRMKTGWQKIDGKQYYFFKSGEMAVGLVEISGKHYYFAPSGEMGTGLQQIGEYKYFFNADGEMQTGWQEVNGNKVYFQADGKMARGWLQIDNEWYYFRADGTKQIGWVKLANGKWYYFNNEGVMQTGWEKINDKWYLLRTDGSMVIGWCKVQNTWYYFTGSGAMQTGWIKLANGKWYYFNASGAMQTGWEKINNKWYLLRTDGSMVIGWCKVQNTWYYFTGSGAMATGWAKLGNTWYYFNASGAMQTGWEKVGNTWYFFNSSGAMQTGWEKIGSKWYYFSSSGAMQTGWHWINGKCYYFYADGSMAVNTTIGGSRVDASGAWVK